MERPKVLIPGALLEAEECTVLTSGLRGTGTGLQVVVKGRREGEGLGGSRGKPTAKSAVTLLVKLANGHLASFAFCRASGELPWVQMVG